VAVGLVIAEAGLGRRTRQFNPASEGAKTLAQWVTAVLAMKGQNDAMDTAAAVAIIRATSASDRSRFAHAIWRKRRANGTDRRA
jgi:hypothetical protein